MKKEIAKTEFVKGIFLGAFIIGFIYLGILILTATKGYGAIYQILGLIILVTIAYYVYHKIIFIKELKERK